jgi:hypothetical protein
MDAVWLVGLGLNLIFSPTADMNKLTFKSSTQNLMIGIGGLFWTIFLIWGFFQFSIGSYLLSLIVWMVLLIPLRYFLFNNALVSLIVGSVITLNCFGIIG